MYILGRFDVCIFDLDETAHLLRQALNFLAHIAYRGGIILFVVRQPQIVHLVERTGENFCIIIMLDEGLMFTYDDFIWRMSDIERRHTYRTRFSKNYCTEWY